MVLPIINICLSSIALIGAIYCFIRWSITYRRLKDVIKAQNMLINIQKNVIEMMAQEKPFEEYKDEGKKNSTETH